MKLTRYPVPTLNEDPSDAVVTSHKLMMRAGLMRKESAGMYDYIPLGLKALRKVTDIVRGEMDASGAVEFLMPELTNADLWKESGRWDTMGPEMFRIKDRNNLEYALGPTHEEAFTHVIRSIITSYKDLPINAYQINTKFRDEIRPRFGVIRSKEFIMKDAYSFDLDQAGLDESYKTMAKTYRRIFKRCGLDTIPVQADSGSMGGSASEEFMVASEVGEETLL
ncbi:MAG: proline--tRNA ligase, partial [Spirochaetota bacterium]